MAKKTPTLKEVIAGADRAVERVRRWPQWMRDLSPTTSSLPPANKDRKEETPCCAEQNLCKIT